MGQHSYVNEKEFKKVNKVNIQLLGDFIKCYETENRSPTTIKNYKGNIQILFIWILHYARNKPFTKVTKRNMWQLQCWMIYIMKLSPARIRNIRDCVNAMSCFIMNNLKEEYPDFKNLIIEIEPPKMQSVKNKISLTTEQFEILLETLIKNEKYQQACFVDILVKSKAKRNEVLQYKIDSFCEESKYFNLWIKERKKLRINNEYLFVVKHGHKWNHANIETFNSWLKTCSEILGVKCSCEIFRVIK